MHILHKSKRGYADYVFSLDVVCMQATVIQPPKQSMGVKDGVATLSFTSLVLEGLPVLLGNVKSSHNKLLAIVSHRTQRF